MPGFDKTGPMGQGSQTGTKMGKCNPDAEPKAESFFSRRRFADRFANENNRNLAGGGKGPGKGLFRGWGRFRGRQA